MDNDVVKKTVGVIALLIVMILSIFVISPITSSQEFHAKTIKSLDDKKITVLGLTTASAGVATALAAVPGDATTPLSNQIMELSSYLLAIIGAIFLEKILLTLTGYVTFKLLIPIACLLYGINLFVEKEVLKKLAIKIGTFGIIIFLVVPTSVTISNLIESKYQNTINQTIEISNSNEISTKEDTSSEESGLKGLTSKVKESISSIGDNVTKSIEKGKELLNSFIDTIAILIITSCVIPIIVLLSFIWIIKIIFDVNITIPDVKKISKKTEK